MGIFSSAANVWKNVVAPISLPLAGGFAGGPAGAMAGSNAAGMLQGKDSSQRDFDIWQMNKNLDSQKEFAQHGIRWKVEDAKAAGIHPLVGLGAQTASFSPISVGGGAEGPSRSQMMSDMGQNISRAVHSTRTQDERDMASLNTQAARLDIEGKALDNQIKLSQLKNMSQPSNPAAFPGSPSFIPGQGNSGPKIIDTPMTRTTSKTGYSEPGAITDTGWLKTRTGIVPVPSKDAKERIEDVMPHEWAHFYRNNAQPNWGAGPVPLKSDLPKGYTDWEWNHRAQEFQAVRRKRVPFGGREPDRSPFEAPSTSRAYPINRR